MKDVSTPNFVTYSLAQSDGPVPHQRLLFVSKILSLLYPYNVLNDSVILSQWFCELPLCTFFS